MRDMTGFFRVARHSGMEHVVLLGTYIALRIGSVRFIVELHRPLRAVEEMKGTLTKSGDDAEDSCSFRSN